MARIFITGSSDGIGSQTARRLIEKGHQVVLHARNPQRAKDASAACPGAEEVLVADLTSLEETKQLAAAANKLGTFDAVLHNAGLYLGMEKVPGKSGMPSLFCVNTLAPFVLASLMHKPKRIAFISSGMHYSGRPRLDGGLESSTYSDSKLHNVMLAKAFARRWPGIESNSADPGWVPTKMGGSHAPDDLNASIDEFVMLALGEGNAKGQTGKYFVNSRLTAPAKVADDVGLQDRLVKELERISGVTMPK